MTTPIKNYVSVQHATQDGFFNVLSVEVNGDRVMVRGGNATLLAGNLDAAGQLSFTATGANRDSVHDDVVVTVTRDGTVTTRLGTGVNPLSTDVVHPQSTSVRPVVNEPVRYDSYHYLDGMRGSPADGTTGTPPKQNDAYDDAYDVDPYSRHSWQYLDSGPQPVQRKKDGGDQN